MFVEFGDTQGDDMIDTARNKDLVKPVVSVCNECYVQPLTKCCRALIAKGKMTWIMA